MNNRNQQNSNRASSLQLTPSPSPTPTYLNVFTVEEFETNGKKAKGWTKIGAAFPHKEGLGFSIELKAFPIDGRLVILPPDSDDNATTNRPSRRIPAALCFMRHTQDAQRIHAAFVAREKA
jgi:hypothetical protein